jgi:hypothetical protein
MSMGESFGSHSAASPGGGLRGSFCALAALRLSTRRSRRWLSQIPVQVPASIECHRRNDADSTREADVAHKVFKARVRAERIKARPQ